MQALEFQELRPRSPKDLGPMGKLAYALLVDTAENIVHPQPTYNKINRYCKSWVNDDVAVDFWFTVLRSGL